LALVKTAVAMNGHHIRRVVDKVIAALDGDVSGRRIALWGLTFKAGTDDIRDSPALEIAKVLVALGASVHAYDPTVAAGTFQRMEVHSSSFSACNGADALIIATEWPEFASADLNVLAAVMGGRVIMDARNVLNPVAAANEGFIYTGIGIPVFEQRDAEVAA
jgi:UDPglucose 6-dehydrogenase